MNNTSYVDLLDEFNCADRCDAVIALCELVDNLVKDIQFLELETVSTRYLLSQYLDKDEGELLRMDILSNLTTRYGGDSAYELYKNIMYSGGDPMEFRDFISKVQMACKGEWPCLH